MEKLEMKFSCNAQCEEQERQRHANKLKTNEYWYLKCLFTLEKSLAEVTREERSCVNVCTLVTVSMSAHSS